ncbi:MAG: [acyl-carrier-protein] S-malonyltransferase [Ignavibacteria bacterium CG_4_8_14_3_um_filter_37_9]|nr:MAG: [acyl-carrier-protein] S-malonyltransferase [Ignavibacteria bacterium CG1_02_37_35]PIW98270.1 MAG: [acyl-carrier-protein] S-malonyltransferase [Ignavibacteria bacterium CG_4_8_14_3_um_filter_37_9]PIX94163.1 MAG: [acyl-carrier-protein] S-malonyltransferase [Ignavibacteria bacterium CG_4_10_14_3_um_filter_37_18]
MGKRAFLFPGQGSQYVGMAKDLFENSAEAKEMMRMADSVLGINLSQIMLEGPEDELRQTEYTQPAIFLHSVVLANLLRTLEGEGAAGHSLGEYSALVSAGAIQFLDAIQLVRSRGVAMQRSGIENPGTMAAVIGVDGSKLEAICVEASNDGIVQCANFNSPGQIVISGSVEGVRKAMQIAKSSGAKLVKELVVSGAFHSPLMQSAKDSLYLELEKSNIFDAKFPVYANVSALPIQQKDEIKKMLFEQVTSPVRWEATIRNMTNDGFDEFVEIGPGKVLQGLVKRIKPNATVFGIDKFFEVEKYL